MITKVKIKNGAVLLSVFLMTGAVVLTGPSLVFAGFELKGYAPQPAEMPQSAAAQLPAQKVPAVETVQLSEEKAPAFATAIPAASPAVESPVISGFGSGLPLVIALQQIAPPGYQFSFAAGFNPGVIVSWEGGKPWKQVLADVLAAQKLGFRLQNNVITVGRFASEYQPDSTIAGQLPAPPGLAGADMISDETFSDFDKPEPMMTRRSGRRSPLSARRDSAAAGHRSLLDRFKDRFTRQDKSKVAAKDGKKAPAAPVQKAILWDKPETPALTPTAPTADAVLEGDIISGFGSELPLTLALQQVVPAGYQFSLATGVNNDTVVSWEGGKPWKQVLTDMLSPQKLDFSLYNDVITVIPRAGKDRPGLPIALAPATRQLPPPIALAGEDAVPADMTPPGAGIEKKAPPALRRNSIVGRRDSIVGQRDQGKDQINWLDRFKSQFTRQQKPVEKLPPALEVAPPPVAVPLITATKPVPKPVWLAAKDRTLKDILTDWSRTAGIELYWSTDYDYRLNANVAYNGTFDEAVGGLLNGFDKIRPQPYGQLHQVLDGSKVLVIKTYALYN